MATEQQQGAPGLSGLVQGTVEDVERLIEQHLQLMRSELKEGLADARQAALSLGTGAGTVVLGGIMGTFMLVHLLHRVTHLPLWTCYGLVGAGLGFTGSGLLSAGMRQAGQLDLVPRQTAQVLREELTGTTR